MGHGGPWPEELELLSFYNSPGGGGGMAWITRTVEDSESSKLPDVAIQCGRGNLSELVSHFWLFILLLLLPLRLEQSQI